MEFKKPTSKTLKIIAAVIVAILLFKVASSYFQDKDLKDDIKDREEKIDQIDDEKTPILEDITADAERIKELDKKILALSNKQKELLRTIKNLRNENNRIKDIYINNPIDKRIELFARLATEKDSTR